MDAQTHDAKINVGESLTLPDGVELEVSSARNGIVAYWIKENGCRSFGARRTGDFFHCGYGKRVAVKFKETGGKKTSDEWARIAITAPPQCFL